MTPIRNYLQENRYGYNRIVVMFVAVGLLALVLAVRVGYLQISQHDRFEELAQSNRIDLVPLPPVRGLIYDRNGEVLAQNFLVYNLEVLPDKVQDMDALLDQLGQLVELKEDDLERFRALLKRRPSFERQTLRANLSEKEASRLAVNLHRYPGAEFRARLQRDYTRGNLTAHVVGYVGRISADDLEQIDNEKYRGLEYIGKNGIEAFYETTLLGKSGFKQVETNAHGKIIRSLEQVPPEAGKVLHLSLDIRLQEKAMELLGGYEGAVVAIEPATGDVLAFASMPGYDPNPFVNGIGKKAYGELRTSDRRPLLNRALYGRYAPGSTIKGFMTLVSMQKGVSPHDRVFCNGYYRLPNGKRRYRDWKKTGHGSVDAHDAIEQSCNVYYYQLAKRLGIDSMHEGMGQFGFGHHTGIDLLGEPSGLMPSRQWKQEIHQQPWTPGETLIIGIGQGYMLITPLQLATVTATLANRGRKVVPRFLTAIENPQTHTWERLPPGVTGRVAGNNPLDFDYVIRAMRDVVHGKKGTARLSGRGLQYEMAGKTGTAQVKKVGQNETYREEETEKRFRDHSLFIGFAPLDDPKIAIAVIVEHAGGGSRIAAPMARKLLDYYLIERLGLFPPEDGDSDTGNRLAKLD